MIAGRERRRGPELPNPSEGGWPGLATAPSGPLRARVAEQLFRRAVRELDVRVVPPDGRWFGAGGPGSPVLRLNRPGAFYRRLGAAGTIGFGEAYMVEDWTSTELVELLTPFAATLARLVPPAWQRLRRLVVPATPARERGSLEGARANARRHYDLSNELFAAFLDETMTYSGAWFDGDPGADLAAAQRRKIDAVLELAGVGPGQRILEIGTGWGALAIRAAQLGAQVTTLTLSVEQRALAERRIAEAGVAERVQVLLRDYREAHGHYQAVVSVEMIEAVGAQYWPAYFAALDRLLAPGGRVALQTITMRHDRLLATQGSYNWIHKYVFPGGVIPSITAIEQNLAAYSTLRIVRRRRFGPDYARTLAHWRSRFRASWPRVAALGFDPTFRRMWEFYLAYCEAGFRSGYLDLHQLGLTR